MNFDNIDIRRDAGEAAARQIKSISSRSKLEVIENQVHEVAWSDVREGTTIGIGGFSRVYKVEIDLPQLNNSESFALKCLNASTMGKRNSFLVGAKDLAAEGEILSRLRHENVIKVHGVTSGGPAEAFLESERGYFLILDLLEDTLSNKLETFRRKYKKKTTRRAIRGAKAISLDHVAACSTERIKTVGLGVARGMEYLHSMGIVMRDLKPDNVGFDSNGTPKIFDFGFAREVHTLNPLEVAGSLRYMAPEVARGDGTSLASDVYSFGVLLFEICTLEKPFKEVSSTKEDFMASVVHGDFRPPLALVQSVGLRRLIAECWDPNPDARPTMDRVVKVLRIEILKLHGYHPETDSDTTSDERAKGTFSNPPESSGLSLLNSSFGISTCNLGGRSNSFSRINSWTAKKLSSSTLGGFRSLSRGSSAGSTSKSKTAKQSVWNMINESNSSSTSSPRSSLQANATFPLSLKGGFQESSMGVSRGVSDSCAQFSSSSSRQQNMLLSRNKGPSPMNMEAWAKLREAQRFVPHSQLMAGLSQGPPPSLPKPKRFSLAKGTGARRLNPLALWSPTRSVAMLPSMKGFNIALPEDSETSELAPATSNHQAAKVEGSSTLRVEASSEEVELATVVSGDGRHDWARHQRAKDTLHESCPELYLESQINS